jgi:hypothetical protein
LEEGLTGSGRVRVEVQVVEGKDTKWRMYVKEIRRCIGARKGSHGMVEIKLLCFRWLSASFKLVQKGFPGFA